MNKTAGQETSQVVPQYFQTILTSFNSIVSYNEATTFAPATTIRNNHSIRGIRAGIFVMCFDQSCLNFKA